jgi:hypothetical protein
MPEGNPLVADAKQDPDGPGAMTAGNGDYGWAGGIGIAESSMDAFNGIKDGDWVSGGLGVLSLAGEVAGAAVDPFGYLMSSVASFLMEHVQPLKDMLDSLAGNPPVIQSYADTWGNVAKALGERKTEFDDAVRNGTAGWTGDGADAYRKFATEHSDALSGAATVAGAISTVTMIMGQVVAFVRETVRQLIADLVGKLIAWVMEEVFSLGFGTPVVVAQASAAIAKWGKKIGELLKKLTDTIRRVSPLLSKLVDTFEKIAKVFGKVLGKVSGLDGLKVKESGFVHKVPRDGPDVRTGGAHGGSDDSPGGSSGEPDAPGADPLHTDSSSGADSRSRRSSDSPDGDGSPAGSGDSPTARPGADSASHAGDSSPSAQGGDNAPGHAGNSHPAARAGDNSPSPAGDSAPSPRAADAGPAARAGGNSPSHATDSGPSARAGDHPPSHAGNAGPSARTGDSSPSHAADPSPTPVHTGNSGPASHTSGNSPSHATDPHPTPVHTGNSTPASHASGSFPSHAADPNPTPIHTGNSGPASHADGGSPAHSGSSPTGRSDGPGSHAGGDSPGSAAPSRADGATSASGTAPAAPRTGDPGTQFPSPRGGDGTAPAGIPPQGGAPMGGGMPPGGSPGGSPGGGGPGGGAPRTGGAGGWTGTPGSPGAHPPHAPGAPGRPRAGDSADAPGRPGTGGAGTPRPRTPEPAARGFGPGTHGPDSPGTRPAGPGRTGPGGTHAPGSRGPGGPPSPETRNPGGTRGPDTGNPGGTHPPDSHSPGTHGPDDGTPGPGHHDPDSTPHHGDSAPLSPDEVNARHSESTPAGSSYHAGDPDMGDLPHRVRPDPDGRYTVDVHVTPDGHARIGDRLYTPEEFADVLRRNGDYDGRPVRLIGCDAGSNDFAHRLSRELDTEVMAPDKPAWTDSHGRVFSSDYEIGPDGRMRPRIPPDGEWSVHRPDGTTHAAGDAGFAPDTRHHEPHDVDADSARHRGDDDNPRQRGAAPEGADPDNPRQRQAPPPGADPDVPADRNPRSRHQEQDLTDPQRQAEVRRNPQHGTEWVPSGGEHVPVSPGSAHPGAPEPPHAGERFPGEQRLQPHRSYEVVDADGNPRGTYHTDGTGRVTHIDTAHPNVPPRLPTGQADPAFRPNPGYHPNPDVTHPHPDTTYRVEIDGHHQTFHTDAEGVPHPSVQYHRPDFEGEPVTIAHDDPRAPKPTKSFASGGPYEPHTRYEVTDRNGVHRGTFHTGADGHVRWAEVDSGRIAARNPDWPGIRNDRLVPGDAEVRLQQRIDPAAEVPPHATNPERFRGAGRHDVRLPRTESFLDSVDRNPDGSPKLERNSKYVVESEYTDGTRTYSQTRSVYWTDDSGRIAHVETFRPHHPDLNHPAPGTVYSVDDGRFTYQTGPEVRRGHTDTVLGHHADAELADGGDLDRRSPSAQGRSGHLGPAGMYDGGHIAGNQFKGPGELVNMISQWWPQNRGNKAIAGPDHWYAFESDLAEHLKKGGKVEGVDVFPLRADGERVPHTIQVRWVETDALGNRSVHLRSFTNTPPATP